MPRRKLPKANGTKIYNELPEYFEGTSHEILTRKEEYEHGRNIQDWKRIKSTPQEHLKKQAKNLNPPKTLKEYLSEAKTKAKESRDTMILSNQRLLMKIAYSYRNRGMDFPDLVQEGNLGLLKAANEYDPEKGYKFSTYASWWIRQRIGEAVSEKARTIRIPKYMLESIKEIEKKEKQLKEEYKRDFTIEEVKETLPHLKAKRIESIIETQKTLTLEHKAQMEKHIEDPNENTKPEYLAMKKEDYENLLSAVKKLPKRDQIIISQKFGLNGENSQTLKEIGKGLKMSRERIRQIKVTILKNLERKLAPLYQ